MNIISVLTPKRELVLLTCNMNVKEALDVMQSNRINEAPLIDNEGKYIETLTQGDLVRYIGERLFSNLERASKVSILEVEPARKYVGIHLEIGMKYVVEVTKFQSFVPIVDDRGMFIGFVNKHSVESKGLQDKYNSRRYSKVYA